MDNSKNILDDSSIDAGRDIHIGDETNNTNHYTNSGNSTTNTYHKKESSNHGSIILGVVSVIALSIVAIVAIIYFTSIQTSDILPFKAENTISNKNTENEAINKVPTLETSEDKKSSLPTDIPPKKTTHPSKKQVIEEPTVNIKPKVKRNVLAEYTVISQSPKMAMLPASTNRLSEYHHKIIRHIISNGISISNTFFRPSFYSKFGRKIESLNLGNLNDFNLSAKINCICQIEESITVRPNDALGNGIYTARGNVKVHVLNLKTSQKKTYTLKPTANGGGVSEESALSLLEERFIQADNFKSINLNYCK